MKHLRQTVVPLVLLLAIVLGSCADLEVVNLNEPDRDRALTSLEDVTSLISDSYNTWFHGVFGYSGPGLFFNQAPFQQGSPYSCRGLLYSHIPRVAFENDPASHYYRNITRPWFYSYRSIAALADGLGVLRASEHSREGTAEELDAIEAFGRFNQGLAHATLAAFYGRGYRIDETTDVGEEQTPLGYQDLMEASMDYFDQAIDLAGSTDFSLPFGWMAADVTSEDLARLSHSLKARFRAQMARTTEERQAVDWHAVIADVDAGIQADFNMEMDWDNGWYNAVLDYSTWNGYGQLPYFIYGMADQSGNYQEWLDLPIYSKDVRFTDGRAVLIVTPDLRFPRGSTVQAQREGSGSYFHITSEIQQGNTWKKPERGTWRWSWYKAGPRGTDYGLDAQFNQPLIRLEEMRLLKAEGLFRIGNLGGAAAIVNETRVQAGLSPTDASGSNESCVPRLPDNSCGGLWEMLKWEKRMETVWTGTAGANWWFDSRGWGDLWEDSPLQIPMPCGEMAILGMTPCHTFGGPGGEMGSTGTSYAFESTGLFGGGGPSVSLGPPSIPEANVCEAPFRGG